VDPPVFISGCSAHWHSCGCGKSGGCSAGADLFNSSSMGCLWHVEWGHECEEIRSLRAHSTTKKRKEGVSLIIQPRLPTRGARGGSLERTWLCSCVSYSSATFLLLDERLASPSPEVSRSTPPKSSSYVFLPFTSYYCDAPGITDTLPSQPCTLVYDSSKTQPKSNNGAEIEEPVKHAFVNPTLSSMIRGKTQPKPNNGAKILPCHLGGWADSATTNTRTHTHIHTDTHKHTHNNRILAKQWRNCLANRDTKRGGMKRQKAKSSFLLHLNPQ